MLGLNKVLLVEDQYDEKFKRLARILTSQSQVEFEKVHCISEALGKLRDNLYGLVIVDIQIPERLGDEISSSGGVKLIELAILNDEINKPGYFLGVTSHRATYREHVTFLMSLDGIWSTVLKIIFRLWKSWC